jgi:hypothetical protein
VNFPTHRGNVHDLAPALLAHARQDQPGEGQRAEHVGFELGAHALVGDRLDGSRLAVAGVVDQHADRALGRHHGVDRGASRGVVDDIESQRLAALRLQVGKRFRAARGRVHGPAAGGETSGGRGADAGRAARDQHRA